MYRDATWMDTNIHARWFGDINGDGKADMVGFAAYAVVVQFGSGSKDELALDQTINLTTT